MWICYCIWPIDPRGRLILGAYPKIWGVRSQNQSTLSCERKLDKSIFHLVEDDSLEFVGICGVSFYCLSDLGW